MIITFIIFIIIIIILYYYYYYYYYYKLNIAIITENNAQSQRKLSDHYKWHKASNQKDKLFKRQADEPSGWEKEPDVDNEHKSSYSFDILLLILSLFIYY